MIVNIVLNNDLKFNVLKKSNKTYNFLIIFNNSYFLKLLLDNNSNIFFLKNLNFLVIRFDFYKNNNVEVLLNNITNSLNLYFMKKIIFSGKGYKIKKSHKNKNNLDKFFVFYFNKSHLNVLYFFSSKIKKLKKTKMVISSVNPHLLIKICNDIIKVRPFNIFTQKGLRLSRQTIYKKIGKKSS